MKEFSKEVINIDGVDYTLFLNRKGIVAYEKFCKDENQKIQDLQEKYKSIVNSENENCEITEETNPFDGLDDVESIEDDAKTLRVVFKRLYWIMLYTEHQLSISKASELYDKACDEYGEEALIQLASQMIEDANTDKVGNKELKKLTALRPKN